MITEQTLKTPEEMKKIIERAGADKREIAKMLGIAYSTLAGKLNGFAGWTVVEQEKIFDFVNFSK